MLTTLACRSSDWLRRLRLVVAQVELHSAGIVDLRRDLLSVVCVLRFRFPHFPALQQNRERLHLRHTDGHFRTDPECLAVI